MADFGKTRSVLIIVENLLVPRDRRVWLLLLLFERWTFRSSDLAIATDDSFRRVAISRGGMDPDRVLVVRSGPDLDKVWIVPPDPCLRRGQAHLVGYLGVMNSQDVRDRRRTQVGFVLIGDGPDRARLERLAKELDVADAITFTSWLDADAQLPWLKELGEERFNV